MMSPQDIVKSIGAALLIGWGVYVEWRLHLALNANTVMKRELNDKIIEDSTHAESDSQLRADLNKFVGPSTRKS